MADCARDPGVVVDEAGEYYLVWGVFQYYIARLNSDMVSFAEEPRKLVVKKGRVTARDGRALVAMP